MSFVKVCFPGLPNPPLGSTATSSSGSSGLRGWVVALVVIGAVAGLVLCEWALWYIFCRNNPKYGLASAQYALLEYASGAPVQFSYRELQRSTKGFNEKLGAGGFGAVYRGVLANRTVVAVKQLEGIEQGEKQFRMDVAISSTHHLNLVRLIGFCSEGRHRLLVFVLVVDSVRSTEALSAVTLLSATSPIRLSEGEFNLRSASFVLFFASFAEPLNTKDAPV